MPTEDEQRNVDDAADLLPRWRCRRRQREGINDIMEAMATVHITEAELARDIHTVLAKVQQGAEIVVEQDHRPVAVIRSPLPKGRLLSECIALAEARGSTVTLDDGFMKDVEDGIASRSQPWNPPSWD
jgi:antitoxin (DNA-binding transcriptional repressor) of toxin-antitoxin stability system